MGPIIGRWLIASVGLGALAGALYGTFVAATLGSTDDVGLVSDAPIALLLGVGVGIGSFVGVIVGLLLGGLLGPIMAVTNSRMRPATTEQYLRRVRIVAALIPLLVGLSVLLVIDRFNGGEVIPIAGAALVWGVTAPRIARGYQDRWPAPARPFGPGQS